MDELSILFRDEVLLAVDKPSGLLVHRGWGRDPVTLMDMVYTSTGLPTIHPVHRLDRATSGVILIALDPDVARELADRFSRGEIEKRYLALVRGRAPESGLIDHPIQKDFQKKKAGPRVPARTAFRTLHVAETEPRHVSLVEAAPLTGRAHQVRRHLRHINHPLIGDTTHGESKLNHAFADNYGLSRLALHSLSLRFEHPVTNENMRIHAPLAGDLGAAFLRMEIPESIWTEAVFEDLDWPCDLTANCMD